jgi:hypothetical protein
LSARRLAPQNKRTVMGRKSRYSASVGLLLALYAAPGIYGATRIKVRLLTPVSSYHSKAGDTIEALIVPSACTVPIHAFPGGTLLYGNVRTVRRVGLGLIHETARLRLDFTELRFPNGEKSQISTRLIDIDNARERVDGKGVIHGIRATSSIASRIGSRIAIEAFEHPFLLGPALVLESGLFRFPDPEIEYGRGTQFSLDAFLPESLPEPACQATENEAGTEAPNGLRRLVDGLPRWSYSKRQPQPMDLINLVFVGSRQEIEAAFAAAGWTGSQPNSMFAGLRVVRALAEQREYAFAPMRTLLLNGDEADLSLQSTLNTFDKRDHLRIWEQHDDWEGRGVWASAATKDVATTFSMGHPFGFTHEIQGNVDLERDKVVSDLQLTGCVDLVEYVNRGPSAGPESRKGVYTDSRVAVLVLNECETPAEDFSEPSREPPPALSVRVVRRLTLTTRNHFLRDNIIWRGADAARMGINAVRHWQARRTQQRLAASSALQASVQ